MESTESQAITMDKQDTESLHGTTRQRSVQRRQARRRRITIGIIVTAVILALTGAGVAYASTRPLPIDERFIIGEVTTGDLTSTLTYTGTVSHTNKATLYFPASGTVESVKVAAGDTVTAGTIIATMTPTSLQQAVDTAQANLDQAKLTLYEAKNSSSSVSSGSTPSSSSGQSDSSSNGVSNQMRDATTVLQKAQSNVDQTSRNVDLACDLGISEDPNPTPESEGQPTPSDELSAPVDNTPVPNPSEISIEQCLAAIQAFQKAVSTLSKASDTVVSLAQQTVASGDQTSGTTDSSSASSSRTSSSVNLGTSGGTSTVSVATAEAQVLQAQQSLDKAKQNLAAATMVSPIDGVVGQLPFATGDSVSSSSSVVIIGTGGVTITVSIPVTRVPLIAVDQEAVIAQNSLKVAASVSSVSLIPTSGTNYSVTVTSTDSTTDTLLETAPATVTITTAIIKGATLVPISAITIDATGTSGTVQVVAQGEVVTQQVSVSAIGDTHVAVADGVKTGDRIVLADTTQDLPTSTSGLGGFGGSGGPPR